MAFSWAAPRGKLERCTYSRSWKSERQRQTADSEDGRDDCDWALHDDFWVRAVVWKKIWRSMIVTECGKFVMTWRGKNHIPRSSEDNHSGRKSKVNKLDQELSICLQAVKRVPASAFLVPPTSSFATHFLLQALVPWLITFFGENAPSIRGMQHCFIPLWAPI